MPAMMMTLSMSMNPGVSLLPLMMMLMVPAAMMMKKEAEVFVLAASPKT